MKFCSKVVNLWCYKDRLSKFIPISKSYESCVKINKMTRVFYLLFIFNRHGEDKKTLFTSKLRKMDFKKRFYMVHIVIILFYLIQSKMIVLVCKNHIKIHNKTLSK